MPTRSLLAPSLLALLVVVLAPTAPANANPSEGVASPAQTEKGDEKKKPKDGATKDDYTLDVSKTSKELKVNGTGKFALIITPVAGLKVHPQAPLEIRLKASDGVKPDRNKLGRGQVTDKESTAPELTCDLRGEKAGDETIDAEVSFFLCSDAWCQRMKDRVSVAVRVKE